jgi:hypothetical protein
LFEIDPIVLACGVDAPLDLDVGIVTVPVQHPDARGRDDAQQREAGRTREEFDDLEQALAHAAVGDGGRDEPPRVIVAIQELASRDRRRIAPSKHRNRPRGARLLVFVFVGAKLLLSAFD